MGRKRQNGDAEDNQLQVSRELWVSPNHSVKGNRGERGWGHRIIPPNSGRLLELADIALGVKKPSRKKARAAAATHQSGKSEPYSQT
jgi:hypothetical protein